MKWTPERRQAHAATLQQRWADPIWREKQQAKLRASWTPERRAKQQTVSMPRPQHPHKPRGPRPLELREQHRQCMRALWADPAFRAKMMANRSKQAAVVSERMKKIWADPELRAKQIASLNKSEARKTGAKKYWENPEARAKQSAAMKKRWAARGAKQAIATPRLPRPPWTEAQRLAQSKRRKEYEAKKGSEVRVAFAEKIRKTYAAKDPAFREAQAERMRALAKKNWADPAFRAKMKDPAMHIAAAHTRRSNRSKKYWTTERRQEKAITQKALMADPVRRAEQRKRAKEWWKNPANREKNFAAKAAYWTDENRQIHSAKLRAYHAEKRIARWQDERAAAEGLRDEQEFIAFQRRMGWPTPRSMSLDEFRAKFGIVDPPHKPVQHPKFKSQAELMAYWRNRIGTVPPPEARPYRSFQEQIDEFRARRGMPPELEEVNAERAKRGLPPLTSLG